eukprot:8334423-Ditylum_brightwellii.AAC.1
MRLNSTRALQCFEVLKSELQAHQGTHDHSCTMLLFSDSSIDKEKRVATLNAASRDKGWLKPQEHSQYGKE